MSKWPDRVYRPQEVREQRKAKRVAVGMPMQHGLLARRLFTRDESVRATFDHLLGNLREDWQPVGTLEEMLLENIAISYYRLHVVYGYEAEYAKSPAGFFLSIDRTGRYATSINRQLTQDVNQFERLQRQRKGEFVPAPISLEVTVTGLEKEDSGDPPTPGDSVSPVSADVVVSMDSDLLSVSSASDVSEFPTPRDLAPERPPSVSPVGVSDGRPAGPPRGPLKLPNSNYETNPSQLPPHEVGDVGPA
jgi:hypothetical protein